MAGIPLEDNVVDIIGKAQRGFKLSDGDLARRAGIAVADLARVLGGGTDETLLRKIARALNLGKGALVESARKAWYPASVDLPGLAQFNTPYADMRVNAYLAWDPARRDAAAFDTGADCRPILDFAAAHRLSIKVILLTHGHEDHIADLTRLHKATGAPAFVGQHEAVDEAEAFAPGHTFLVGRLRIETRPTSGHSVGGITYLISGLAKPVAVTGDSIFAGSMGGGVVSYLEALANNRRQILTLPPETVLCPGHGPMSTVGEEQRHNPFFPEFQKD
jgi:hydroxyacylglutathione hydrolase